MQIYVVLSLSVCSFRTLDIDYLGIIGSFVLGEKGM